MAIKRGKPKRNQKDKTTNDQTGNTQTTTASTTTTKRSKPKDHKTRMIVVEGVVVEADPYVIASNDEDSNYIDMAYVQASENELEERTPRPRRGKTFLPLNPTAVKTKEENIEAKKKSYPAKEQNKEEKKKTTQNRIMTRNKKRLEREKKIRVSKGRKQNITFYQDAVV